ncbi:hypothetical protein HII27_26955, partial [Kluyvera sp. SCKS090646]|nr:hypothetical protein [Kluyvera sichuanensis]
MNDITALAQRMEKVDPRDAFEKLFPLPAFCVRCGTGYASTSFNGWDANKHQARWEGWKAAMALMESRTVTVKLPELCVGVVQGGHAVMVPYAAGHWFNKTAILEMLAAAGIQVI